MKKAEAISILAASVRPREAKDRARYDEAVKMAIEALKCSETPKSSERTSETAQADHIADTGKKVGRTAESAQNTSSCAHENDVIFRQAAIDAVEKSMYENPHENEIHRGMHDHEHRHFLTILMGLPSAQPATNCSEIPNSSDDTISRQAALDAIMGQPPEPHYPSWYAPQIEKLPAAQPDLSEYSDKLWRSAYERGEAEAEKPQWIPCSERLPAVPVCRCLITRDDGRGRVTVEEALFSFSRWYDNKYLEDGRNRKFDISASVIAWAPFPAPYRGGDT